MKITFIRHGEAEDYGACTIEEDRQRPLTKRGRKIVTERFETLAEMTEGEKREIWSSPLLRARQTADILSKALDTEISVVNYLTVANSEHFKAELEKTDVSDLHLFVVSHEPFVSDFIRMITGKHLRVHTGDAITVNVENKKELKGELLLEESLRA